MPKAIEISDAKARVLEAAETLFHTRGYKAITLRDIANQVGLNHASLYHHVPGGKEALYVEVMERTFRKHQSHLEEAIREAGKDLRAQLQAASRWMLSQPPIDFTRMMLSDMTAISKSASKRLSMSAYVAFMSPFEKAFLTAYQAGQIGMISDARILAGSMLAIIQSVHSVPLEPHHTSVSKQSMVDEMVDVLLDGLRRRN
jgi:AcrR family transcriptional regulator